MAGRIHPRSWLARTIVIVFAASLTVGAARIVRQRVGDRPLRVVTLPANSERWVNSLVPERTGALAAAWFLHLPAQHGDELGQVLREAYDRMDAAVGDVPTPTIATYLGMQSPAAFDTVVIAAKHAAKPQRAVIFLHGYAGNFSIYCWQFAQAVDTIDALVVCPSVGPRGDWWKPHGLATVRATLAYLKERGISHVFLAGLSNGATGAGVIAPRIAAALDGLILISGAPQIEPPARVPLLVIQGTYDTMMPAALARRYAQSASGPHRYVSIDSGHFAFLSHWREVTAAIRDWLAHEVGPRHG